MLGLSRGVGRAIRLLNLGDMVLECLPFWCLRYLEGRRLELLQILSRSITLSKNQRCPSGQALVNAAVISTQAHRIYDEAAKMIHVALNS